MEKPAAPDRRENMLRNMNEKIDNIWSFMKEMREDMKEMREDMDKQAEHFKNSFARLEKKLDTALVKNVEEKVGTNYEDDSITAPVAEVHSTETISVEKEDGTETADVVEQQRKSCEEADAALDAKEVKVQRLELCGSAENVGKESEHPTVEELKKCFWWLVDSTCKRFPLTCIICGGKMHPNLKQLHKHAEGEKHRNGLLACNNFKKLQGYVAAEKLRLAAELGLDVNAVFFRWKKDTEVEPSLSAAVRKSKYWCVSFQSKGANVIEMTVVGTGICISFFRWIFRSPFTVNNQIALLKEIFEGEVEKIGKDVWFLTLILFNMYGIRSQNCSTIFSVDLTQAPIVDIDNLFMCLMANALSVKRILPGTPAFLSREGPLSFSKDNETVLKSLCSFCREVDDEREEFNLDHWRCFFKCVKLSDNGEVLSIVPVPGKYKLRPGSRARIHTGSGYFDGMADAFMKHGVAKLHIKEKVTGGKSGVKAIDVERYNELNIRLLECMNYVVLYLSGKRVQLNPFEELFLLASHENLVNYPFLKRADNVFLQVSGKDLNDAQAEAVRNADNAVSYCVGPPGTGKTTVISAVVAKALCNDKGILVMCETNNAVKQVCDTLLANRVCSSRMLTLLVSKEYYDENLYDYEAGIAQTKLRERYSRVLLCTLSKAKHVKSEELIKFRTTRSFEYRDTAIIDEGGRVSCCCFSQVLPLLDHFKRLVVSGDPKQGGPFSSKNRTLRSVITVLQKRAQESAVVKKGFLNIQYRMELDIGELVSTTFYDGKVESFLKRSGENLFYHDVRGEIGTRNKSIFCKKEADLAMRYAKRILQKHRVSTVAILCYYTSQRRYISDSRGRDNFGRRLMVSSVDGFQGKDADFVIISTCAQKFDVKEHIGRKERANVAISRGRRRVILLGDKYSLSNNGLWSVILAGMKHIRGNVCSDEAIL